MRNNWSTEKTQRPRYADADTGNTAIAAWKDLVSVYKKESEYIVKQTSISCAALYPKNFEKQNKNSCTTGIS